jgi:ubiquinone/menaquinone biosynthesis C-methylase UbiE
MVDEDTQRERPGILVGVAERHGRRSAARNAAFFLAYLRSGMRVLDVGCGPGAITVGLAKAVVPGEVVGIDLDPEPIARAQGLVGERGLANVHFEIGNVNELPFPDQSFDAAFAHTLFMHLENPIGAASEVLRVLKPGGVFGVSERMQEGSVTSTFPPLLLQYFDLYYAWAEKRGVKLAIGGRLRALLRQAGFERVDASASYGEVYGTLESTREFAQLMLTVIRQSSLAQFAAQSALADAATLDQMAEAWQVWAEDPTSFHAQANGEAIAWRGA